MTKPRSSRPSSTPALYVMGSLVLMLVAFLAVRHSQGIGIRNSLRDSLRLVYHMVRAATAQPNPASVPVDRADEPLVLYADGIANGWQDWSWAEHDPLSTKHERDGKHSIRMTPDGHKGIYLHHDTLDMGGYSDLDFWVYSDETKHKTIGISTVEPNGGKFGAQFKIPTITSGWNHIRIPLTQLGVSPHAGGQISGLAIQDTTGHHQGDLFFATIRILPDETLPPALTAATVAVTVDVSLERHPISSLVYGVAHISGDMAKSWHVGANRWGGNGNSRYNWKRGVNNAARDWEFRNRGGKPGEKPADEFASANKAVGVPTVLTIPTIGWVAKDDDFQHRSLDVPYQGGPAVTDMDHGAIAGYDPQENRERTSVRSVAREKNANPGEVAQDAWVRHLVATLGDAAHGGVPIYAMDNEPDLWSVTHTDIHPAEMGYDDVLSCFLDYATAVKDADPTALISGPVSWGWTGYFYSALDRGTDNYHTHSDRVAHGDMPFMPWFFKQVYAHDQKAGRRSLDILDVHYYPQADGIYSARADTRTQERRLRATRSLWDPSYSDESWIGEPVRLVPRLQEWVATNYPGTKIGITEWNFGADQDISGGLAIADALGIFGREGIYLANYWTYPAINSPGFLAFQLFRNTDGKGHGFGDISCHAQTDDVSRLSCFAATDSATGDLTLLLVNKMRKATITAPISLHNAGLLGRPVLYRLLPGKTTLSTESADPITGDTWKVSLPPFSAVLVRFVKEKTAS